MQNDVQSPETVILGVDTHLDIHVGAVISQAGKLLGTRIIQTSQTGYQELLDLAEYFGVLKRAGIEGTGTYGAALTRFLIKNGLYIVEVNRPDRSKRRLEGKSDPLDAENWTIALVLMRSDPCTRVYVDRRTGEGLSTKEILRCLKRYIVRELYPLILSDLAYANRPLLT
ncbi:TPA: transposase [Klebsiella aerogenes]